MLNGLVLLLFISEALAGINVLSAVENVISRPIQETLADLKDFIEIAAENGYIAEKHEVVTEDGYILTMFRIPPGNNCTKKVPILVMHGLLQGAEGFLDAGPEAPGFLLAQECYDSWFGNVRGNYHSRRHKTLNPDKDLKFWQFSVDEIGKYDVPAMVDYVLDATAMKQLIYLGYSQGGLAFFVMNSERPEYAKKIKLFFVLAPASRQYNTRSELLRVAASTVNSLRISLETAGVWEILSQGFPIQGSLTTLCTVELLSAVVCGLANTLVDSSHPGSVTPETQKRLFQHAPAGTSIQNFAWYGQSFKSLKFSKFDFGRVKNMQVYGKTTPPEYNMGAAKSPAVIFHGDGDHLVDTKDVAWAVERLPNVLEFYIVKDPLWNHLDLCYSRYWKDIIFVPVKKYLKQYGSIDDNFKSVTKKKTSLNKIQ
ncbi:lipase 3-like [Cydia splendana]|uniref:lipase 3-like n=1 Tax=Cydia splendana TaxID=1100963 RepID=UPI00300CD4FA